MPKGPGPSSVSPGKRAGNSWTLPLRPKPSGRPISGTSTARSPAWPPCPRGDGLPAKSCARKCNDSANHGPVPDRTGKTTSSPPSWAGRAADRLDLFDRVQLAEVLRICRESATLSRAGRSLFSVSRTRKKAVNDADRLRKYLGRFGLTWPGHSSGLNGQLIFSSRAFMAGSRGGS